MHNLRIAMAAWLGCFWVLLLLGSLATCSGAAAAAAPSSATWHKYRASPKLTAPLARMAHADDDQLLNQLDAALREVSTVHIQALFSETHTAELDRRMLGMELELFDLLDALYRQQRMADYMRYEGEVTRQMILYNMLKKLFGYEAVEGSR